jgi:hypothetical protein
MQSSRLLALAVGAVLAAPAVAQFPNDDCTGAIAISQGVWGPYSNVGAATSPEPWTCGVGNGGPTADLWYSYVAPASGPLTVSLCVGTSFDSVLEVYDATGGCGALTSVGCNDDGCGPGGPSNVTVSVTSGVTYLIRVGGWGNASYSVGGFAIDVNGPLPSGSIVATNTPLGAGCVRAVASLYEHFVTTPSIDLSNTSFQFLAAAGGFIVLPGSATFVTPSATAVNLGLGDDTETTVTLSAPFPAPGGATTTLTVGSNGHIATASNGAAGDYTPTPGEFLAWTNPTWAVWRDMICTATGNVLFEEVAGVAYFTWNNVIGYVGTAQGTTPSTFQFQFDLASGNVNLVFQSMDTVSISGWSGGEGWVVGYSSPGLSLDPGSADLSALTTVVLPPADVQPLALIGASRPVLGTTWNLTTSNVPATGLIGVDVFGLSDPGLNDLFFLGAPGCGLRAALDVTNAWFVAGSTHSYSLAIPSNPALLNFNLYTTSAVFQVPTVNALGAITSNGIQGMIGNI